jgi:hypothetical protein
MRRITPAVKRAAERRERENAAKRLAEVVPKLDALTFTIEEIDSERAKKLAQPEVMHTRYIVVSRAPAVFDLPCYDRHCDGGHDVTKSVLGALQNRKTRFTGRHRCAGHSKHGDCRLELRFTAEAHYQS